MTRRTVVEREARRFAGPDAPVVTPADFADLVEAMRRVERATLARVRAALRNLRELHLKYAREDEADGLVGLAAKHRDMEAALEAAMLACCRPERKR